MLYTCTAASTICLTVAILSAHGVSPACDTSSSSSPVRSGFLKSIGLYCIEECWRALTRSCPTSTSSLADGAVAGGEEIWQQLFGQCC